MNTTIEKILRESVSNGKTFPTPVYILHQTALEENIDELYRAFNRRFRHFIFAYSCKTNYAPDILRTVYGKGGYVEVVSPLELALALNHVPARNVIYNGVIPDTVAKYELAKAGGIVNVENLTELRAINSLARREGQTVETGIRVNLALPGTAPSRFGMEMNRETISEIFKLRNVRITGIHCHITKSRGLDFWRERAEQMALAAEKTGTVSYIDFGGNMYGRMHPNLAAQFHCAIPTFQDYADCIHDVLSRHFHPDSMPDVIVEAGTPVIANAQSLLTSVLDVKNVCGKTICTLDAKQLDVSVIGDSGKQLPYTVLNFGESRVQNAAMYGCTCLETDLFVESYTGSLSVGDLVLFENIGAYSNVLAPRFIQNVPAMLKYSPDGFTLIKRPDSYQTVFGDYL